MTATLTYASRFSRDETSNDQRDRLSKDDIFCAGRVGQMAKLWSILSRREKIGGIESGEVLEQVARDSTHGRSRVCLFSIG